MKPVSLCFVKMGTKGLELVSSHPRNLPKPILDAVTYKAMPLGAQPGDFCNSSVGKLRYSSYIIKLDRKNERDNIAAFIAVFVDDDYEKYIIHETFDTIFKELEKKSLLQLEIVKSLMPKIYDGLQSGQIKIDLDRKLNLDFNLNDINKKRSDKPKSIDDDIW